MNFKKLIIFCFLLKAFFLFGQQYPDTAKPWTYWWWMGSAVNKTDIKHQLIEFSKSGLGGVHIVPIYGVKGYEAQFLPFLSEEWLEMVQYSIHEAEKLNLGVDITLGTGWPYGGSWVNKDLAAKKLVLKEYNFNQSSKIAPGMLPINISLYLM